MRSSLRLRAAACVLLVAGCHGDEQGANGLPEPALTEWRGLTLATELWRIGTYDGPEHQSLGGIGGAGFVGDDLVLSDAMTDRVHWYAKTGVHVSSMGGSGRGPGEFIEPRGIEALPDGRVAVVNIGGGGVEVFDRKGEFVERLTFAGAPQEICALDHDLVVLGVMGESDAPVHLFSLSGGEIIKSLGHTDAGEVDNPHRGRLISGLIQGAVECMDDSIVYARSSDGTVSLFERGGSVIWRTSVPQFIPMVHEPGSGGIRHGPAAGANEMHGFVGVWHLGETLAAQVWRVDITRDEVSLYTVFLEPSSGRIIGKDEGLPLILAVDGGRVAVEAEESVPTVIVYSAMVHTPPSGT